MIRKKGSTVKLRLKNLDYTWDESKDQWVCVEDPTLTVTSAGLISHCRPLLVAFAVAMENRLRENDHKPNQWRLHTWQSLLGKAQEKLYKLWHGCSYGANEGIVREEAADVANYVMMLWDAWASAEYCPHCGRKCVLDKEGMCAFCHIDRASGESLSDMQFKRGAPVDAKALMEGFDMGSNKQ